MSTPFLLRQIGYRDKAREEASRGGSLAHRPDIALATEVSKLTSQVRREQPAQTICCVGAHRPNERHFLLFAFNGHTAEKHRFVFVPIGLQGNKSVARSIVVAADSAD